MPDTNTPEIELPPLPTLPHGVGAYYTGTHVHQLMQDYARAAILADRGEAVAEIVENNEFINIECTVQTCSVIIDWHEDDIRNLPIGTKLYTVRAAMGGDAE